MAKLLFISIILLLALAIPADSFANTNSSIKKTQNKPTIDGVLSQNEWDTLLPQRSFIQLQPQKGSPSSEKTIVFANFDEKNLYLAFACMQLNNPIVANVQSRDKISGNDDAIYFWLDTYLDQRSAYAFAINPLGTQTDFKISDDGRNTNYEWDGEWNSATKVYDWGWVAEIEIPFSVLKYKINRNEWGINFGRVIQNNSEQAWWSGIVNDNFRISQGGILSGLTLNKKSETIIATPYASVRYEDSDITGSQNEIIPDIGGDILWNITPNLSANLTINPDFASVEGDKVKIDLSGWEIDFPEKRLFFQEGNEMFDMRYPVFYSRRIGDIDYGVKLTGKTGPVSLNVLNVLSPQKDSLNPAAFYTAMRAKADVFKSSTLGFTLADKSSIDSNIARTFGLDWVMNPGKKMKITGQLIGSSPGTFIQNAGGFIRVAHESSKHHVHLRYSNLGENMKQNMNQLGFLNDDDRHELDADLTYTFWLKNSFIRYLSMANKNNLYWSKEGEFKGYKFRNVAKLFLQNKLSYSIYYDNRYTLRNVMDVDSNYFNKKFYNYFLEHTLAYNSDASSHASITYTHGRNFNRSMNILSAKVTFQPLKRLIIDYQFAFLNFSPDTIPYTGIRLEQYTVLNICTIDYYFTNNIWIRIFGQHSTYKQRIYLYGQVGWRFKPPFGALYLIYNGEDFYDTIDDGYKNHQTVFLKVTYPLSW